MDGLEDGGRDGGSGSGRDGVAVVGEGLWELRGIQQGDEAAGLEMCKLELTSVQGTTVKSCAQEATVQQRAAPPTIPAETNAETHL